MATEADDILEEGKRLFEIAETAERDNRESAEADMRFVAGEQWPDEIVKQRTAEGRPTLTINRMPAFVRQVVNDARQNKPAVKVHPADSKADPATAEMLAGLIRNIEYTSNADVAYDTGIECAVKGGVGYWRIVADYAYDDAFDMDLLIKRIANPFSVFGDPHSSEADSADWMNAFVTETVTEDQWKTKYKSKAKTDWADTDAWGDSSWRDKDSAVVAEWWSRKEAAIKIAQLLDRRSGQLVTLSEDELKTDEDIQQLLQAGLLEFKRERVGKTFKVKQRVLSGAEVLEENDWAGCYIPIVPVYGDDFDIKGKRYLRSLIHDAKDAARMNNYWRSTSTELVALAPRTPYIGPSGAFDDDERWNTVNTVSHPYLEYKGALPPQRQPLDSGTAAGALQEALNASDDIKAILGIYDASLGARSNETSGRAIMARQREGDVSTFHFGDNQSRAIRHTGRILLDLIPHFYTKERVVRVLGEDGKPKNVPLGQQYQQTDDKGQPMVDQGGDPVLAMHDLSVGKYDITVTPGPSFTTRREEAAYQMTEMMRAFPQAAPIIGPELAKNLDWPGADKISEKLEAMTGGQVPPQVQQMIEVGKQKIGELTQQNQQLQQDRATDIAKIRSDEEIEREKIASNERIAREKIASEANIALMRANAQVQAAQSAPQQ